MVFFIILNSNWTLDDANTKRLAKKCIVFIKSWNSHTKVERWILKSFIALEHGTVIKAFFALIYPSIFSSADLFSFRRKSSKCNKTVLNVQRERERAVINKLHFPQNFKFANPSAIICQFLSLNPIESKCCCQGFRYGTCENGGKCTVFVRILFAPHFER